jgi:hypothetical protein
LLLLLLLVLLLLLFAGFMDLNAGDIAGSFQVRPGRWQVEAARQRTGNTTMQSVAFCMTLT